MHLGLLSTRTPNCSSEPLIGKSRFPFVEGLGFEEGFLGRPTFFFLGKGSTEAGEEGWSSVKGFEDCWFSISLRWAKTFWRDSVGEDATFLGPGSGDPALTNSAQNTTLIPPSWLIFYCAYSTLMTCSRTTLLIILVNRRIFKYLCLIIYYSPDCWHHSTAETRVVCQDYIFPRVLDGWLLHDELPFKTVFRYAWNTQCNWITFNLQYNSQNLLQVLSPNVAHTFSACSYSSLEHGSPVRSLQIICNIRLGF